MSVKLYYAPGACSFASHVAIEETGVPYEAVKLNLAEGDQRIRIRRYRARRT